MDRVITYIGAIPRTRDILNTNRNAMISDGLVAQGLLGTATLFSGLACTPTGPATLTVNVAPGCVFSQQNVDNSAYGVLASDTTEQIVKIGASLDTGNFACPAPATTGQSVVYLIQAAFEEVDTGDIVLPYYNAANPAMPWAGPNNDGTSQNTARQNVCNVEIKTGTPATTGTQTIPAPDAGFTGLWAVTVAHGQTSVTSGNISQITGAPFISETLTQKISQSVADARYVQATDVQNSNLISGIDSSGAANSIVVNLSPVPVSLAQKLICVTIANTNTGASNLTLNALTPKAITYRGNPLVGGELVAGQNALFSYNGTAWNLVSPSAIANVAVTRSALFTSTGTWTCPPGVTSVLVDAAAGGAGGAGSNGTTGGGEGGGGGDSCKATQVTVVPGTTYTITIGAAGAAGTISGNGGDGGATSLGTLLVLNGGHGGSFSAGAGFAGGPGASSGGDPNLLFPGGGGSSMFGTGAPPRSSGGVSGGGYGAGGSGGAVSAGPTGNTGGAGTKGFMFIWW